MPYPSSDNKRRVADALRHRIITGAIAFGTRLSDKALAEEFGVSRTPVREALLALMTRGLVVIRAQSGTFVFAPTPDEIREVCELRGVLEAGALRLAVGRDPDALAARLAHPLAGASLALADGDLEACDRFDTAFHEALADLSGNAHLVEAYHAIADKVRALRHRLPRDRERMARAHDQHRRVLDLAVAGRLPAAEAELAAHVRNVQGLLTRLNVAPPPQPVPASRRRP